MLKVEIDKIGIYRNNSVETILSNCLMEIMPGKVYILTGTNGSGKSTFAFAITGLLNKNTHFTEGSVLFNGIDMLNCPLETMQKIRKTEIKYVFQDPVNAFNPLKKFDYYFTLTDAGLKEIENLLDFFLLPPYNKIRGLYPYEVSVGMAQRISIILALLVKPKLIVMDEPNSALDLTSSNLLMQIVKEYKNSSASFLIITQDILFAQKTGDEFFIVENKTVSPFLKDESLLVFPEKIS